MTSELFLEIASINPAENLELTQSSKNNKKIWSTFS